MLPLNKSDVCMGSQGTKSHACRHFPWYPHAQGSTTTIFSTTLHFILEIPKYKLLAMIPWCVPSTYPQCVLELHNLAIPERHLTNQWFWFLNSFLNLTLKCGELTRNPPMYPLGKTEAEVEAELKGVADADRIRPHKVFEGNRVRRLAISSMKTAVRYKKKS